MVYLGSSMLTAQFSMKWQGAKHSLSWSSKDYLLEDTYSVWQACVGEGKTLLYKGEGTPNTPVKYKGTLTEVLIALYIEGIHRVTLIDSVKVTLTGFGGGNVWSSLFEGSEASLVPGTEVILTAIPFDGCCFLRWHDGNIQNPRKVTVNTDTHCWAEFEVIR